MSGEGIDADGIGERGFKTRSNASWLHQLVLSDGRNAVEVATSHITIQAFRYRLKIGQPIDRAATAPARPGRFSSVRAR